MLSKSKRNVPFSSINLIGRCNLNCYYCKGNSFNDKINHLTTHFKEWKNFPKYIAQLKENKIDNVYIKGYNTDPSLYAYLEPLIVYLVNKGFSIGIKTTGYVDITHLCWFMKGEITYSIHSLNSNINRQICGTFDIPNWDIIIPNSGKLVNIAIPINRYNENDVSNTIKYLNKFDNINQIQLKSYSSYEEDIKAYENTRLKLLDSGKIIFDEDNFTYEYYTNGTIICPNTLVYKQG